MSPELHLVIVMLSMLLALLPWAAYEYFAARRQVKRAREGV